MKNYFMRCCLVCPFLLCILTALVWVHGRNGVTDVKTATYFFPNNETWKPMWNLHLPIASIDQTSPTTVLQEQRPYINNTEISFSFPSPPMDSSKPTTPHFPGLSLHHNNSSTHKHHRYVIEWIHWEQMTMAVQSLVQLAWFTASWNASTVEPFMYNSYFHGLTNRAHTYHSMSDIFDMNRFNEILLHHSIPPLTQFTDFVKHGSKNILAIHVFFRDNDGKVFGSMSSVNRLAIFELFRKEKSNVVLCEKTVYMRMIGSQLSHAINFALQPKQGSYKVVKCCCINGFESTSRDIVREKCGISDLEEDHTIVVTDWRGVSSKLNFRLFSPEFQSADIPREIVYPYNQRVEENAANFLRSFSNSNPVLFIHFRSEKLAAMELTMKGYFDKCVKESLEIKEQVLSKNTSQTYVVRCVTDVTKHGSRTCKKNNCPGRKLINIAVKKYKLNTVSYDPRKFHGVLDSTFVAAVEQVAMSMADVLILVGGGSFQNQLKYRYMSNHQSQNSELYQVCN